MEARISLILLFSTVCSSIKVVEDWILPTVAYTGETVDLRCNYVLQGETIHTIKWYKDDMEFFRYAPSDAPTKTVFLQNGIKISKSSQPTHIILEGVVPATSGYYKCEISGGPPRYMTAVRSTQLQIIEIPQTPPKIFGVYPSYSPGDRLNITCESGVGSPPPTLTWFLHGAVVRQEYQEALSPIYPVESDNRGISRNLLKLEVRAKHFRGFDVECRASILDLYAESSEVHIKVNGGFPLPRSSSAASSSSTASMLIVCSMLVSL